MKPHHSFVEEILRDPSRQLVAYEENNKKIIVCVCVEGSCVYLTTGDPQRDSDGYLDLTRVSESHSGKTLATIL